MILLIKYVGNFVTEFQVVDSISEISGIVENCYRFAIFWLKLGIHEFHNYEYFGIELLSHRRGFMITCSERGATDIRFKYFFCFMK